MKQAKFIAAAALAVALGGPALAFGMGGGHGPQIDFETLDSDGNGEVTKAEMQAQAAARFSGADTDGDGKLSTEELTAASQARISERVAQMLGRFDEDGDGALSMAEMPKPRRNLDRMFDVIDADDSGAISKAEFDEARAWMGERHRGGKGHGRHGRN